MEVQVAINTGVVISGVVGEIKPQFSLVGDSILLAQKLCNLCPPGKIVVTKLTHHYLELYTNNYSFQASQVPIMGFGNEPTYYVSTTRGKMKAQQEKNAVKTFDGNLLAPRGMPDKVPENGGEQPDKEPGSPRNENK